MINRVIVALIIFVLPTVAASQEYFGKFSEGPSGEFISGNDRPVFRLKQNFAFEDPNGFPWPVPSGVEVDGASIPQVFWSFIGGPFSGEYLPASVVHDYYCEKKSKTSHDTHRSFYYGMRANGVEVWRAKLMYWAVATFGPSWDVKKRVVSKFSCAEENGMLTCNDVSEIIPEIVEINKIDFADPQVRSIILNKFTAVAKTLKTTDGEIFDVTASGNIYASIDSIEASSKSMKELLATDSWKSNPASLGILSIYDGKKLENIGTWPGGIIPSGSDIQYLSDVIKSPAEMDGGFLLGAGQQDLLDSISRMNNSVYEMPSKFQ